MEEKKEMVDISSLIIPFKEIEIEFPGYDGFKVKLCHLGKDEKAKLIKDSTKTKFVKHQAVSELDDDLFLEKFARATIKGWNGFKYEYLQKLMLVDIQNLSKSDLVPFSENNAFALLNNSEGFDNWVVEVVGDLENFTKDK